ncbi:MAG TPA: transglycosylase SLT domain-containing protein [Gemmatimonadaceae bacterium]
MDQWVHRFTGSLKAGFAVALAREKAYRAMIPLKLAQQNMPQELIYVAMIESNFNPRARSQASAVGLWQFVASTARRFGLTVSAHADDRINAAKSTDFLETASGDARLRSENHRCSSHRQKPHAYGFSA